MMKFCRLFIVYLTGLFSLAIALDLILVNLPYTPPVDPFMKFADLMPGSDMSGANYYSIQGSYYNWYDGENGAIYYYLKFTDDNVTTAMVTGHQHIISDVYFRTKGILLGDLVGVWKQPIRIYSGRWYRDYIFENGNAAMAWNWNESPPGSLFTPVDSVTIRSLK